MSNKIVSRYFCNNGHETRVETPAGEFIERTTQCKQCGKTAFKKFVPNDLFFKIEEFYNQRQAKKGKAIICAEGSTGAGKTWSIFYFFYVLCDMNRGLNLDIYFCRDTLINCRQKTLLDFQHFLEYIGEWDSKNLKEYPQPEYTLFGQKIRFRGLDDDEKQEGYKSDFIYINEALDCQESAIANLRTRCKFAMLLDWNPKYSAADLFKYEGREDTIFLKTTYKDNLENLERAKIEEIESYNPDNEENVRRGTANKFKWQVYALGLRANKEGLVFPDVTWVSEFPADIDNISWGMDFGEAAQTAIVKAGIDMRDGKRDLYLEGRYYKPTANSDIIFNVLVDIKNKERDIMIWNKMSALKIGRVEAERDLPNPLGIVWCDNNQPGWISDLRRPHVINGVRYEGFQALPTPKFNGSRNYWITTLKKWKIHIVSNEDFKKEQENFCYDDDSKTGKTIKKWDHYLSSSGYACVGKFARL